MPPEGGDLFIGVGVDAWGGADVFGDDSRDGFRDDIDTNAQGAMVFCDLAPIECECVDVD